MARPRLSLEGRQLVQAALEKYRRLAVQAASAEDVKAADEALGVLYKLLPRARGRPRSGAKRGLEWHDVKLETQIAAVLKGRDFDDSETITHALTAIKGLATESLAERDRVLTKAQIETLRKLASRRTAEAREVAIYILAWRANVGVREAKRLRELPLEALIHY